ncbi:hypothetical protein P3L10_028111 [Capsicum annuum]
MVFHGAPTIVIAVALSLAVEITNLASFKGTNDDTTTHLWKKLEYLVSRPFMLKEF